MARLDTRNGVELVGLSLVTQQLMSDIRAKSQMKTMNYEDGPLTIQSTIPRLSKKFIDGLDAILAQHYGLDDEELDFIINYDVKYRMGIGSGG